MTASRLHLSASGLLSTIRQRFTSVPDGRTEASSISMADALMSGLAVFSLKCPSLLQFDQQRRDPIVDSNLHTLYDFTWITDQPLHPDSVYTIMRGGRARWPIENETFNTLKNPGYHLEHNYGHGTQYLSSVFAFRRGGGCAPANEYLKCTTGGTPDRQTAHLAGISVQYGENEVKSARVSGYRSCWGRSGG